MRYFKDSENNVYTDDTLRHEYNSFMEMDEAIEEIIIDGTSYNPQLTFEEWIDEWFLSGFDTSEITEEEYNKLAKTLIANIHVLSYHTNDDTTECLVEYKGKTEAFIFLHHELAYIDANSCIPYLVNGAGWYEEYPDKAAYYEATGMEPECGEYEMSKDAYFKLHKLFNEEEYKELVQTADCI